MPKPDGEAFMAALRGDKTERVHMIELYLDGEVREAIAMQFGVWEDLDRADPDFEAKAEIAIQRFLGYDFVRVDCPGWAWDFGKLVAEDTADFQREGGRGFVNEGTGPITDWESFEAFDWPTRDQIDRRKMDFFERELPDDMVAIAWQTAHFAEHINFALGYENLCYTLMDDRDLVAALRDKLIEIFEAQVGLFLEYDCVKALFPSDDMGFRTGTLISPDDLREFVLPGHQRLAEMCHAAGRPYLLHSCGQIETIMPDLLNDVKIDARHSYEDTILPVECAHAKYGDRIAILGGIDLDFLCRATPDEVRARTREVLDACWSKGGYLLGTGNSVANYVPLESYWAMMDEGHAYVR